MAHETQAVNDAAEMEHVEVERRFFSEVFWTSMVIFTVICLGVYAFVASSGPAPADGEVVTGGFGHNYAKAGFLASMTVIGGLVTASGMAASAAIAAFALGDRKLDPNTIWLVLLVLLMGFGLVTHLDVSQFKDAAIEGASVAVPGGLMGVAMMFLPTVSRVMKLVRRKK